MLRIRRREPAVTQAYKILRQAVLRNRFRPGERLIETELAEMLGVSRTPIREALSKLEAEGLVEPSPTGGVVVRDLEAEFIEIYGLRQRIEGYAAFLAAQRITPEELAALEEAYQQAVAAIDDPSFERRAELNNEFHRLLIQASHSPRLIRLVSDYRDYMLNRQLLLFYDREMSLRQHEQHRKIIEALRNRDADRAERLVREHFETASRIIQSGRDKQGTPDQQGKEEDRTE